MRFCTPTELRAGGALARADDFAAVFARVRDRLSTLRTLYGAGPLDIDFRGLAQQAREIRTVHSSLQWMGVVRRSTRTGAVHSLAGFTGAVEYEGDLTEFVPFLEAAYWSGVGRHTVWGNGVIETTTL